MGKIVEIIIDTIYFTVAVLVGAAGCFVIVRETYNRCINPPAELPSPRAVDDPQLQAQEIEMVGDQAT